MADVNEVALAFVGTQMQPEGLEADEVAKDAERCAICGYWSWKDEVDDGGTCEACRRREDGEG